MGRNAHRKPGRPPRPPIPGGYQTLHIALPAALVARLDAIAKADRRSLTATIELRLAGTLAEAAPEDRARAE